MKIDNLGPTGAAGGIRKKGGTTASGDFAALIGGEEEEVPSTSAAGGTSSLGGIGNLLVAQMIDADEERKRAIQHGDDLLDTLDSLRHDLLSGTVHPSTIQNLALKMRASVSMANDPQLADILNEIETRAAVELAKLELAQEKGRS